MNATEKVRWRFSDGSVTDLLDARSLHGSPDISKRVQFHSSLVNRLPLEKELEGHVGCVNAIAWNSNGSLLISGSDDTRGSLLPVKLMMVDGSYGRKEQERLLKCLQGMERSHPYDCAVATSGIDNTIKLWTPDAEATSMVAGPEIDVLNAIESNQRKLSRNREILLPFEFLERFRMHEFAEGSLHPVECAQT